MSNACPMIHLSGLAFSIKISTVLKEGAEGIQSSASSWVDKRDGSVRSLTRRSASEAPIVSSHRTIY